MTEQSGNESAGAKARTIRDFLRCARRYKTMKVTDKTISAVMKDLRSRVKPGNCARTREQLTNAIAARWPNGKRKRGKSTDKVKA